MPASGLLKSESFTIGGSIPALGLSKPGSLFAMLLFDQQPAKKNEEMRTVVIAVCLSF